MAVISTNLVQGVLRASVALMLTILGCGSNSGNEAGAPAPPSVPGSLGRVGNTADATAATQSGMVLMGGSTDVDAAIQWMIQRASGGDCVVLRASGGTGYNSYILGLGNLNSVETFLINTRALANDPQVIDRVNKAEMVFIAGGDQSDYVNFWKDTALETALNALIQTKQIPIGGTSAGCAILGRVYFDATTLGTTSLVSAEALANPYLSKITLQRDNFLAAPYLQDVITDTHFAQRTREGRLLVFLARMRTDWGILPRGIGVDERTAVCIDAVGKAAVLGTGMAYFMRAASLANAPEVCTTGQPLTWNHSGSAVQVLEYTATASPTLGFDMTTWQTLGSPAPGVWKNYSVTAGVVSVN